MPKVQIDKSAKEIIIRKYRLFQDFVHPETAKQLEFGFPFTFLG